MYKTWYTVKSIESPMARNAENLKECYKKCTILYQNNSKEKEQCKERCRAKYLQIS
ncbi:hypothetical protein HN51_035454, partial [Arachis hypogaea]